MRMCSPSMIKKPIASVGGIIRKRQDFIRMPSNCSWVPMDWMWIQRKMEITLSAIVKNIHEEDPDLPIYLVHTIYPANQDGIGSWNNKGYALYGDRYKYEEDQKVFHLMTYLEDILA